MLKQEIYQKASDVFGVSIGVATHVQYTNVKEQQEDKGTTPETLKKVTDEVEINDIIAKAIESGRYKDLQQHIFWQNRKRHPRTKEVTIYKRAWKYILNDR